MATPKEKGSQNPEITTIPNTITRRGLIKGLSLAASAIAIKPAIDTIEKISNIGAKPQNPNSAAVNIEPAAQPQEKLKLALGRNLIENNSFQSFEFIPYDNPEGIVKIPIGWYEINNNYNHAKLTEYATDRGDNAISSELFVENGQLKRATWATFTRNVDDRSQFLLTFFYKIQGEEAADVSQVKPIVRLETLRANTTTSGPGVSKIFSEAIPGFWLPAEMIVKFTPGTDSVIPNFSAVDLSKNPVFDKLRREVLYTNIYLGKLIHPGDPQYPTNPFNKPSSA